MKESKFVKTLMEKKNLKGICHRNHGSAYGTAGLPDIEGCIRKQTYVLEAKIGKLKSNNEISLKTPYTSIQNYWLVEYDKEGAFSFLVIYLENIKKAGFFNNFPELKDIFFNSAIELKLNINQRVTNTKYLTKFLSSEYIETKVLT